MTTLGDSNFIIEACTCDFHLKLKSIILVISNASFDRSFDETQNFMAV